MMILRDSRPHPDDVSIPRSHRTLPYVSNHTSLACHVRLWVRFLAAVHGFRMCRLRHLSYVMPTGLNESYNHAGRATKGFYIPLGFQDVKELLNLLLLHKSRVRWLRGIETSSGCGRLFPSIIILWSVLHIWGCLRQLSMVFHVSSHGVLFLISEWVYAFRVTFTVTQKTRLTSGMHFLN